MAGQDAEADGEGDGDAEEEEEERRRGRRGPAAAKADDAEASMEEALSGRRKRMEDTARRERRGAWEEGKVRL